MSIDAPEAMVLVLLILYMVIKDVVAPMVKKRNGQNSDDVLKTMNFLTIAVKVLETKVDHLSADFSEMRKTIKDFAGKR